MILSDARANMNLNDYGILIPVLDSRVSNTLEFLESRCGSSFRSRFIDKIDGALEPEDLLRVHEPSYVERLLGSGLEGEVLSAYELIDESGKPHRYDPSIAKGSFASLFKTVRFSAAGTLSAARVALKSGFCFYLGGGYHHAHYDHGSGFCLINDIVVASRRLQHEGLARKIWVIDVDAHKGDGTAALTRDDDSIRTLSIHMARGWPLDEENLARPREAALVLIPSDVEIPIEAERNDRYLPELRAGLSRLEALDPRKPDLAIVVDGSDPYERDELPSSAGLHLSLPELLERDILIKEFLAARDIPSVWLMSGGYGPHVWQVYAQFLEKVCLG